MIRGKTYKGFNRQAGSGRARRGGQGDCSRLRNAGMEVIYTGLRQSTEKIMLGSIQEDVDVLGLSILSGSHVELCQELMEGFREKGIGILW